VGRAHPPGQLPAPLSTGEPVAGSRVIVAGQDNRGGRKPTGNPEARTLYLKGRYFWNKRTDEDIQTALDYFHQAVDLDPGYSPAWVGIADVWIFWGWYSRLAPRETFPRAKRAVAMALEFDSTSAEAHTSLAHIHLEFDHDWDAAEREYRRAIELNPEYAIAHHWYGGFLSAMGRHQEALQQAEIARTLDPLSLIIQTWVGLRYYFAETMRPPSWSTGRPWNWTAISRPRIGTSAGPTRKPAASRRPSPRPSGQWR
jgi:tetratricopeptide (TPR) repeat protein